MDIIHTVNGRIRSLAGVSPHTVARVARVGLGISVLMLAGAATVAGDGYSVVTHTISESGAQGSSNPWVMRGGILLTSLSVLALTNISLQWNRRARHWLRTYAVSLVLLAFLPESPWTGAAHNETVATLHTVAGVTATVAFVIGALAVWTTRAPTARFARILDWVVIASVVVIPQLMLMVTYDGLLQRVAVGVGFFWLFVEATRVVETTREKTATL